MCAFSHWTLLHTRTHLRASSHALIVFTCGENGATPDARLCFLSFLHNNTVDYENFYCLHQRLRLINLVWLFTEYFHIEHHSMFKYPCMIVWSGNREWRCLLAHGQWPCCWVGRFIWREHWLCQFTCPLLISLWRREVISSVEFLSSYVIHSEVIMRYAYTFLFLS
jgi:hypothetical protein